MEMEAPLTDSIRGRVCGVISWTPKMEEAFYNIKKALCNDVFMVTLDFSKPFILQTEAS